jgi:hypothetical protein
MYIKYVCHTCKGATRIPFSDAADQDCPNCIDGFIHQDIECPEIEQVIADLVSLREDLTTILTAIHNKVKNLK